MASKGRNMQFQLQDILSVLNKLCFWLNSPLISDTTVFNPLYREALQLIPSRRNVSTEGQKFLSILWNPASQRRVRNIPPLVPILSQMNSIHILYILLATSVTKECATSVLFPDDRGRISPRNVGTCLPSKRWRKSCWLQSSQPCCQNLITCFYPFVIKLLLTTIKRCFMRAGGFIVTNYYKTNWILSKLYFITIYIHFHVIHNNNITHSLTPHSTVLLEKLTGSAASQEIPRIFGTRRFLAVLTSAHHLSLSWANSIQSPQLPPTSTRSILILSPIYFWVSPMISFPQVSPPEPCAHLSPPPYVPHVPPI